MTALSWKSNFNGTEYRIFRGKVIAGLLKTSTWKNEGRGELDGYMLTFVTRGFFNQYTEIRDINGLRVLGGIDYNLFRNTADITYEGMHYKWQFDSWTRIKWRVSNEEAEALFQPAGFWKKRGDITNEDVPAPIILSSFFVQAYFHKIASAS